MSNLWGFAALALGLSMTPGPDDVLVVSSTVRGGLRMGMVTAAGVAAGTLAWGAAAATGLGVVMSRPGPVSETVRVAGAVYLVLLGAETLIASMSDRARRPAVAYRSDTADRACRPGTRTAFTTGLVSDLLNPKIGLFYLAVLPRFLPAGKPAAPYAFLLCTIDVAIAMAWLLLLARLARAVIDRLRRPSVLRWSEAFLGVSLICLGAMVTVG